MNDPKPTSAQRLMVEQLLNTATPEYPRGKLTKNDAGALAVAISSDKQTKTIIVRFGEPTDWIGLGKDDALNLAKALTEQANKL